MIKFIRNWLRTRFGKAVLSTLELAFVTGAAYFAQTFQSPTQATAWHALRAAGLAALYAVIKQVGALQKSNGTTKVV